MSRIIIAAVCVLFAGISHAQDNPRFDVAGPDYVKEGDEINLSCTTDADVQFMASKQLAIVHKNLVTETETIISEQQSLLVTPAENYEIKLEMIPIVRVTLKIKSATAAADGEYTCRTQKTGTSDALESATKTVVFLGISHAQDNPRFDVPGPDYVKEGDEINLSCTTDANVQFIVSKQLAIVHKNLVTETETIISELQILLVTQADNYVIKLEMIPIVRVTLKLKSATAAADGEYTCRTQKRGTSDALESATKTVVFLGISHAQDNPRFDVPGPDYVKEGEEINLSCTTDADVQFMASKQLAIVHKNLVTETETIISEQQRLLVTPADNYVIKLEMIPIVRVTLKIKSATAAADGEYTCRTQKTGTSDALESTTKTVVFLAPVSGIKLTVDGEEKADGVTVSSKSKKLSVTCEAMGSNPAPVIYIMAGDQHINTGDVTAILDKDGNTERRSYKAMVSFELDFDHRLFNKVLKCHAEPDLPEGVTMESGDQTVSVTLEGIVDKPMVACSNKTASANDRRVILTCFVSKIPAVKSVMFNVGNRHLLYPGNQTKSLTEVVQKDFNATHNEVILKFFEMEEWHFTANIYLDVKGLDDQVFQYPVYLIRGISHVQDNPRFDVTGPDYVKEGDEINLSCTTDADVQFMASKQLAIVHKNLVTETETIISEQQRLLVSPADNYVIKFEMIPIVRVILKIKSATAAADGEYTCRTQKRGTSDALESATKTVVFLGISHAQDNPRFDVTGPDYVKEGDEINLSCTTDADVEFMASKQLAIVHKNLVTETETIISEQMSILVTPADNYMIKLEIIPIVRVTLKIKSATAAADGEYTCRTQKTETSDALESATKTVVFLAPVSGIELTVDGEEKADGVTVSSKSKTLSVTCEAMGSNPAPVIHLMAGDQHLNTGDVTVILDKDGNTERRSYKAAVIYELDFDHRLFNKVLKCHAEPDLPEGVTMESGDQTVTVTLEGIVDKPMVACSNKTASANDRRVILTCFVSKIPAVKSVMFNVGNRHLLYPGNQTKSLTEVVQKDFNATHNEVILKFFEMEEWHFTANIYLDVKGLNDQVFQYPVYLIRGISHVQDNPRFDVTGPDYVKEGDEINLSCTTDADVQFMASKQLAIVHKNLVTETETIISEQQRLLVSPADNYVIKFEMIPIVRVILKIKSATAAADGEYTCRTQKRGTSDALESATKTVVFLGISHAQDNPRFDVTGPDYVKEGEEINLSCTTDADVQFMASKQLAIVHRNLVTETETIISEQQSLLVSPADNYVIKFEMIPIVRVILKIKSATAAADGEYTCRTQKRGTSDALDSATKTVVFLGISHAQDNPRFDVTGPDYVKEGEEINLSCTTDADVQFMASKQLAIVHRNLVTETETIISEQQSLLVSPADNYVIKFEMIPIVRVILKIKSATAAADGEYTCRTQKRGTSDALESATKTVVFLGISHAQDNPRFDVTGPDYVKEGEEINLSCTTDADVQFMASKQLAIVHRNLVTETETTISEQQSLLVSPADNYVIKFEMIPIVRVILKIKSATAAADGEYTCRTQKRGTSDALESATKTVVFLGISHAQDNPRFDVTGPDYVKEGEEINLSCTTDADVQFMASKQLAIVHRNLVTETETIISEQQSLLVSPADNYVIKFEMIPIVRVILKIKSATAAADGEYTCRTQKRGTSDALESATKTVVFLGISHAQDNPRFDVTGPDYVKEGEEINLSCTTDADVQFMASKQLAIVHRNLVTETETIISEQQSLLVSPADNYVIKFEMIPIVRVILKIKSATAAADGEYTCRTQKRGTSDALESATKTVVFLGISHAQDNPRFDVTGPDYVKEGEEINLSCTTDADVQFMASKQLAIVHRNLVTETETTISEQQSLLVSPADNYVIKFEMIPIVRVILKIKSATAAADGEYTCRTQKRGTSDALESATKTVVFLDLNGATSLTGTTTLSIVCLLAGVLQKV
ncbi:uncharacterized protein LOC124142636 isoform X2 [Haliotis rufescens]|uniref:uncharacterized protein LOC124142636 isoform X2 n=1 Tax=Haliotis rufescens TaxID=6454 RepID=UPI00201F4A42|nr:uncharacterized protein LOC124142636 isoform X2 [Haliotis rufescens]